MESDRTDPPLTAADLDEIDAKLKPCTDPPFEVIGTRVSCGISRRGREIVVRADEHDIDDLEALAALRNHAEPLLALARRGLEAEADPNFKRYVEASLRADPAESKLAAALAELERARAELAGVETESQRWRDRANKLDAMLGGCTYVEDAERDIAIYRSNRAQAWSAAYGKRNVIVGTLSWSAAWSAAEQAQAGQAAKQGGEGDSHEAR